MNLALTVEKMKEICSEYGFVCDNGSIYYRQNNVANYWMNNDMKSCTVFSVLLILVLMLLLSL